MRNDALAKQVDRWSARFLIALAALLPLGLYSAWHTPIGSSSVHEWLPSGQQERRDYDRFVALFGQDQYLLVSWEGCSSEDDRLFAFKKEVDTLGRNNGLIASTMTSADALQSLTTPPIALELDEAKNRLAGFWIGRDGTSATVIEFTKLGIENQAESIESILMAADRVQGIGRSNLKMAGTLYESYAVDASAEASLRKLVLPSTIFATLIAWVCLGSLRYAVIVFLLAGLSQLSAVALVYWSGSVFSAVLIVLPTLVFMLSLAGAVHLVSYYKELRDAPIPYRGAQALMVGFMPCLLSSITTIIGDGSLVFSQLAPVREFGFFCGITLTVATLVLLLAFPSLIDLFHSYGSHRTLSPPISRFERIRRYLPSIRSMVHCLERYSVGISIAGIGLLIATSYGMLRLQTSTKFDKMFSLNSKTIQDMAWIEDHFGSLASIEILIDFRKKLSNSMFERGVKVAQIENALREQAEVGGVLAGTTFLPTLPTSGSMRSVARRAVLTKRLDEAKPSLEEHGMLVENEEIETWRITAKVSSLKDEDYGQLTDKVKEAILRALPNYEKDDSLKITITGLSPVLHHTQRMLLRDLGTSFASAFLMITPLMMWVGRGFLAGLLIMVPNVVPITIVFGAMGWFGWKLDIAGILTASIALGIAVDDTLHFVTRYSLRLREGFSPPDAVEEVLTTCGNAILFTTLINCFAMLPFVWSEFLPTSQFAFMMIAILSLAVLGDLFLLPGLLLSPIGRKIMPPSKRHSNSLPNRHET